MPDTTPEKKATPKKKATARKKTTTRKPAVRTEPTSLKSFNPATGQVVEEIPTTPSADVKEIVAQARKVAPEWADISPDGRAYIMRRVRYRLYELMDEVVDVVSREAGKPRTEALTHDVMPTLLLLLYLERIAGKTLKPERVAPLIGPALAGSRAHIEWRPYGVVGCITPWNYPILNTFLATAPPLFAGNAVVVKPSEVTPACGEMIRRILEPLPSGVASVIQGASEVGAALIDAPVDKISFIGSPVTGRKILEGAAKHLTPAVMELGGLDAAIVCDDADLDHTASGLVWGSFFNAGQTCCSVERVFVHDSIADDLQDLMLAKFKQLRHGPGGEIGPLTAERQLHVVRRHVDDAVKKGAKVLVGGPDAVKNDDGSFWYAPTILDRVTTEMAVANEETFGPVVAMIRVRDDDEAVQRANQEGVNLTASVWTKDKRRGERLMTRLRAGSIATNDHGDMPGMPWAPWGGMGESGFGVLNGKLGLREFAKPTTVAHTVPFRKKLWWYPYTEETDALFRANSAILGAPTVAEKLRATRDVIKLMPKVMKSRL
jgi:acyl-CoA reductase-like NAD-dependent aldehyde dehydrogenase